MARGTSVLGVVSSPHDAREWVSFEDEEEERTWRFDLTFLESSWECIFGDGCQGVLTGPTPELVQGCCSYGAHLIDEEDAARVVSRASELTDDEWQFRSIAPDELVTTSDDGELVTVLIDDACVFLNRPGFSAGPGCAFHTAALRRDQSYIGWKPEVCWQLPLRREDEVIADDHVVTSIGQWERRHWGEGGEEFHWWCSEDPTAHRGRSRVLDSMRDELVEMVGARTYARLVAFVDERAASSKQGVPLPHPVVRFKTP